MTTYKIAYYDNQGDKSIKREMDIPARSVYEANNKFLNGHTGCRVIEIRVMK